MSETQLVFLLLMEFKEKLFVFQTETNGKRTKYVLSDIPALSMKI